MRKRKETLSSRSIFAKRCVLQLACVRTAPSLYVRHRIRKASLALELGCICRSVSLTSVRCHLWLHAMEQRNK